MSAYSSLKSKASKALSRYGMLGCLRLSYEVILTRAAFPNARLIRRPCDIRGRRWMKIGNSFTTGRGLRMEVLPRDRERKHYIEIGNNVQINDFVHIASAELVRIGNNVLIASKVFISDHNHGFYGGCCQQSSPFTPPEERELRIAPVIIEDNVWIGEFVSILPGVRIGAGSVVGTMSVVTRDIPPNSIAVGSPAKVIKKFNLDTNQWERIREEQ